MRANFFLTAIFVSVFLLGAGAVFGVSDAHAKHVIPSPACEKPLEGGIVQCGRSCDDKSTEGIDEHAECSFCSFFYLFQKIVNWVVGRLAPLVALFFVVLGGFLLATSRGDPKQMPLAKNMILLALAGYAVILVSWAIMNAIFAGVGVATWTGLRGGWWQPVCQAAQAPKSPSDFTGQAPSVSATPAVPAFPPTQFQVQPYIIYPKDKPIVPEYETAVNQLTPEIREWYKDKVGKTFTVIAAKVEKSSLDYLTLRCGRSPTSECLADRSMIPQEQVNVILGAAQSLAEKQPPGTIALIFAAGGGGIVGGAPLDNFKGYALVGDWVLEPISGKVNGWGIPCSLAKTESEEKSCEVNVAKGTVAHELGHAFGIVKGPNFPDYDINGHPPVGSETIMLSHEDYPDIGFLPEEREFLRNSLFFMQGPAPVTQKATLSPHVYILEDDGTFDKSDSASITKKFYEKYSDQYDFIGIHYKSGALGGITYAYKVQDTIQQGGIDTKFGRFISIPDRKGGRITADRLATFGSKGRLLGGYVDSFDFNKEYVKRNPTNDPVDLIDTVYFNLLFHELTHYWGVALPDELKEAHHYNWSTKKYDRTHWELYIGSWLSVGHTTRTQLIEKEGKYYLKKDCSKEPKHHDFDLYFMGLKSLEDIKDKLVIIKPYNELPYGPSAPCDTSVELSQDFIRKTYTIQDFIKVLGPRIPSVADAQKDFTIAFVMIVPKGETLNQKQIDTLYWVADKFPVTWYKSTEGRSTLNGIKPKDLTPPTISNVKTSATKSSIKVTWTTNEPASSFVIYEQIPHGLTSVYPNVITNPPEFSTAHEITIENSDWTPISPSTEYSIKIISIDEDYNMASFDAEKIITK